MNNQYKILNHWYDNVQVGQTVDYNLTDQEAYNSPANIPRNWLIRVSPKKPSTSFMGFAGSSYRVLAKDLTISGVSSCNVQNLHGAESNYDLGRAGIVSNNFGIYYNALTGADGSGALEDFYWLFKPDGMGDHLPNTWTNDYNLNEATSGYGSTGLIFQYGIGLIPVDGILPDNSVSTWAGHLNTKDWLSGGSGQKPRFVTTAGMEQVWNLNPLLIQDNILAQWQILQDNPDWQTANSVDAIAGWTWFDTLGKEELEGIDIGLEGNEVIVIVTLKDGYTVPEVDENGFPPILSDIDIPVVLIDMLGNVSISALPIMPFTTDLTIEKSLYTTVTPTSDYTITQETENGGFKDEKEKLTISGKMTHNVLNQVASIKIEADSGYYFSKKPYLNTDFEDNLSMEIISKTKTNKKISSYTIEISYTNSVGTINTGYPKASINYSIEPVYSRTLQIDKLVIDTSTIASVGDKRVVTITGKPGAVFGLAINEQFVNTMDDPNPDVTITRDVVQSIGARSILNRSNGVYDNFNGQEIPVLQGTIGKKGVYTFTQTFPSTEAVKTKTNVAKTSAAFISVDSNDGIRKGDKVYASDFTNLQSPVVSTIAGANTVNLLTDGSAASVTIGDNEQVLFERKKVYDIRLISSLTSTLDSKVKRTCRLFQYPKSTLKLRLYTAATAFTITHFNDVATGLSAGAEHDSVYIGEVDKLTSGKIITVKYLLDIVNSDNFTAVTFPKFDKKNQSNSKWTNSVPIDNSGTDITMLDFSRTALGANTITLTFKFKINKFGREDIIMVLDLDNILTIA
tara:strand:+ start:11914 stop:14301 length:2388 start_codon:yes stop_codon:yes gene_type:complete